MRKALKPTQPRPRSPKPQGPHAGLWRGTGHPSEGRVDPLWGEGRSLNPEVSIHCQLNHTSPTTLVERGEDSFLKGTCGSSRRRQWHPTPVLLPGKSHGRRSLVGYSPWGRTESDTTERLSNSSSSVSSCQTVLSRTQFQLLSVNSVFIHLEKHVLLPAHAATSHI